MNDKCAAGVGRYLEVMAQILNVPLEKIGEASLTYAGRPLTVSSVCTVFARSEILRALRQGALKNNVLAGAHDALTTRICVLLNRVGIEKELMVTGGIAKNVGMLKRLEQITGLEVKTSFEPQIIGALGAALLAQESLKAKKGGKF
jgi:benzoyl-CoA reductase subunit A